MRLLPALLVIVLASPLPGQAAAASAREIERMTAYATLLGRALGCGIDITEGSQKVTEWLDRTFPPGTPEQRQHLSQFAETMRREADSQASGKSPASCDKVGQMTRSMGW